MEKISKARMRQSNQKEIRRAGIVQEKDRGISQEWARRDHAEVMIATVRLKRKIAEIQSKDLDRETDSTARTREGATITETTGDEHD